MEPVFLAGSTRVPSLRHRWSGLDSRQRDERGDNAVRAATIVELLEWKDVREFLQQTVSENLILVINLSRV